MNRKVKLERISFAIILIILFIDLVKPAFKQNFLVSDVKISFKRGSGERVLPKEVIAMKNISNRHKDLDFRLSKRLAIDPLVLQRSVEYLYPIRIDNSNHYIFGSKNDSDFLNCQIIDEQYEIAVYDCKN